MKIYYYFSPNRNKKEMSVVKSIYGDNIIYLHEKPWLFANKFEAGDFLICKSVDELVNVSEEKCDVETITKEYMNLYKLGIEMVYDKSTQCNSLFIKTIINDDQNFEDVLRKCISNYENQRINEIKYSKLRGVTAKLNGNKIGIKKGTKLVTKKSLEVKKAIQTKLKEYGGDLGDEELIKELNVSRNSYYKYKKELKNGGK